CDREILTVNEFPQIRAQLACSISTGEQLAAAPVPEKSFAGAGDPVESDQTGMISAIGQDGHVRTLQEAEKDMILFAIKRYDSQMSEIARRLGIGRSTLYRKLRELGIRHSNDIE